MWVYNCCFRFAPAAGRVKLASSTDCIAKERKKHELVLARVVIGLASLASQGKAFFLLVRFSAFD